MVSGKSVTNSEYGEIYSGRRLAYAIARSAWRLATVASPADDTQYVSVPANTKVWLSMGVVSRGRGESGTVTVNVVEVDPPV